MPFLSVCYELQPPSSTVSPDLSASKTHIISLQLQNSDRSESGVNYNAYYEALRDAIAKAKGKTGQELTKWRDAVGDGEKEKTGGKGEEIDEEGEEVEGEENQEEANGEEC